MNHVVKRKGHKEAFDERKVYASCYAAFLSAHVTHEEAERRCQKVCADVKKWMAKRKAVTSDQLFLAVSKFMRKYDENAAFMYATHRDIS